MEVTKFISRRQQIAWQCYSQAKRTFSASVSAANFVKGPSLAACVHPEKQTIPCLSKSSKLWDKPVLLSERVRFYTADASSTTDKPEKTAGNDAEEPSPPVDKAAKEEVVEPVEDSPRSETSVENDPEAEDSVSQQQEHSEEPVSKVDKLYKAIELEVLAYEPAVLDSYQWFVITAATHLGIKVGKCWSPANPDKMRFNLLKSAFVHKKHQVHYEVRTHHRFLTFHKLTSSTADTFLEYIERNLPEGVGLKVTRVEAKPIPEYLLRQAQQ